MPHVRKMSLVWTSKSIGPKSEGTSVIAPYHLSLYPRDPTFRDPWRRMFPLTGRNRDVGTWRNLASSMAGDCQKIHVSPQKTVHLGP